MELRTSMLLDILESRFGFSDLRAEGAEHVISDINILTQHKVSLIEDGVLYLVAEERFFPTSRQVEEHKAGFLIADKANSVDVFALYRACWKSLTMLQNWDSQLILAEHEHATFSTLIEIGEQVIDLPFGIMGANFEFLCLGGNYSEAILRNEDIEIVESDDAVQTIRYLPSFISHVMSDPSYVQDLQRHEPFYFYLSSRDEISYIQNLFRNDEYIARVFVTHKGDERFSKGKELIIERFFDAVKHLLENGIAWTHEADEQRDRLHVLVHDVLVDQQTSFDAGYLNETARAYGWQPGDSYVVVKFLFYESYRIFSMNTLVQRYLESKFPGSCAICHEHSVIWLVNIDSEDQSQGNYRQIMVDVVREYMCKAGVSDIFDDLNELWVYGQEAADALELGNLYRPHLWYYDFDDYRYLYLQHHLANDFDSKRYAHRGVLTLVEHDESRGTHYVPTLVCFLRNNLNATHAANELYIHRTTLIKRLERIVSLSEIDFSDFEEMQHVRLTLTMLGLL